MRTQGTFSTRVVADQATQATDEERGTLGSGLGRSEAHMLVVGRGTLANGHGFYLVPSSSDPTRYYAVEQLPGRLVCLCKDAFFRRRVFADAGAESASVARVTTRRKKQPARQKPPDVAGCHQLRDSARDTAPVRRDQRPLSARFMR